MFDVNKLSAEKRLSLLEDYVDSLQIRIRNLEYNVAMIANNTGFQEKLVIEGMSYVTYFAGFEELYEDSDEEKGE